MVQDTMKDLIGQPVTGWKLGATSPIMRARAGHDGAIIGRVFESMTFDSPAALEATRFPLARAECEFAFLVNSPIHARSGGWPVDELDDQVELHAALEIIGSRYPQGPGAFTPSTNDEIADNGAGIGFVFGPPLSGWRERDISNLVIDVRVNQGEPAENFLGEGRCPPLLALQQATQMLGERGNRHRSRAVRLDRCGHQSVTRGSWIGGGGRLRRPGPH